MKQFMRITLLTLLLLLFIRLSTMQAAGNISLTTLNTAYTQNFNSLVTADTSEVVPNGWSFSETGNNANTLYTASDGTSNSGDTYSFGIGSDRAFGTVQSGSLISTVGACFTNNTGQPITSLDVSFAGEQWRLGTAGRADRLDFQYSTDATSLTTGTWFHDCNNGRVRWQCHRKSRECHRIHRGLEHCERRDGVYSLDRFQCQRHGRWFGD
jgi:hypothetical protein